jgi:MFS family permease
VSTPSKPFPFRLFTFVFLGWTFDFYDLALFGFLKDHVSRELHLSHGAEAWMLGVALGTSGLGGIAAGALADRFGKRTLLVSTISIYSLGSLVCGLAPNLLWLLIGRGLIGIGVGGEWAIGHALLAEAVAPERRGRGSAALQSGEPVGVALAAIAGFVLAPLFGWRAVMMGSSATALLALLARRTLHISNEVSKRRPRFAEVLAAGLPRRLGAAWLLGVFKLGTYWSCYTWLPSFLLHQMGQSTGRSLTWILTAQGGQFLGMMSFGRVADRAGRRIAFCAYSLLTAVALALLAFAWQRLVEVPVAFWSTMFALGVGSGCTAGFGALLAELFPSEVRALAMGTSYNMARAAQLVTPVIVGWAVARNGLAGGLSVPLVLALLTASWVWVLPETRGILLPRLAEDAAD